MNIHSDTKLPAVDVLRGLAALGVVWFHSRVDLWVGFRAIQSAPNHYSAYAVRRFFRIYPAYLLALLFSFFAALLLFHTTKGQAPEMNLYVSSSLLAQNWVNLGRQIGMNPSLWSIPVEVEFYLVYPVLLSIWRAGGVLPMFLFSLICTAVGGTMFLLGSAYAGVTFLNIL